MLSSTVLIATVILLACGACDGDPHAAGDCDSGWRNNGFTQCEAGCSSSSTALGASGAACTATTVDDVEVSCSRTFEYEGTRGCCVAKDDEVRFADCE